jgi:hypothetical protein
MTSATILRISGKSELIAASVQGQVLTGLSMGEQSEQGGIPLSWEWAKSLKLVGQGLGQDGDT